MSKTIGRPSRIQNPTQFTLYLPKELLTAIKFEHAAVNLNMSEIICKRVRASYGVIPQGKLT